MDTYNKAPHTNKILQCIHGIQNLQNSPELVHVQSSCVSCTAPPDTIFNNIDECHDDLDNDDDQVDDEDNGNQDGDD